MPMYFYGTISTIYPNPFNQAPIDVNFVDITGSLIWWYPMQSTDLSTNNIGLYNYTTQQYDASINGTPIFSNTSYRSGNSSLTLGSGKYVQLPNINLNQSAYTVAFWMNNSKSGYTNYTIFSPTSTASTSYTNAINLQQNSTDNKLYEFVNGTNYYFDTVARNDSNWHLYVWIINVNASSAVNHYINVDNSSNPYTVSLTSFSSINSINNWIGNSTWDISQYVNGVVDDYRLYSGALNSTQIQALWDISNANCYFTSYSVIKSDVNFTINWSGTNIACVSISNKT